jgi:hypothetical protein
LYPANALTVKGQTPVAGLSYGSLYGFLNSDHFLKNNLIVAIVFLI